MCTLKSHVCPHLSPPMKSCLAPSFKDKLTNNSYVYVHYTFVQKNRAKITVHSRLFCIANPAKLTKLCPPRCASHSPLHRVVYPSKQHHLQFATKYKCKTIIFVSRAREFCFAARHTRLHKSLQNAPTIPQRDFFIKAHKNNQQR